MSKDKNIPDIDENDIVYFCYGDSDGEETHKQERRPPQSISDNNDMICIKVDDFINKILRQDSSLKSSTLDKENSKIVENKDNAKCVNAEESSKPLVKSKSNWKFFKNETNRKSESLKRGGNWKFFKSGDEGENHQLHNISSMFDEKNEDNSYSFFVCSQCGECRPFSEQDNEVCGLICKYCTGKPVK